MHLQLCSGDQYLHASVAGDNRAIRLDVAALTTAAAAVSHPAQGSVQCSSEPPSSRVQDAGSGHVSQGSQDANGVGPAAFGQVVEGGWKVAAQLMACACVGGGRLMVCGGQG